MVFDGLEGWRDKQAYTGRAHGASDCVREVCGLHGCSFGSPFYGAIIILRAMALGIWDYHGQGEFSTVHGSNTMQRIS